ncbi:MAG: proteasome accessory factor PafA2 family protein [Fimbriimonadaceae bacterium]
MRWILAGLETEYGLSVEGSGAEDQVEHGKALVRSYPGGCFVGWDYRFESPRADLRGFTQDRLSVDPIDARFDEGRTHGPDADVRSDRILPNGARFYNDHGHPEYATPECRTLCELVLQDLAGEIAVRRAAAAYSGKTGCEVRIFKNNTDFHGASYGTHESFLVPRSLGFDALYRAVAPMLVARQVLCGAGKVGSEAGDPAAYQISQRADFFAEVHNVDTLYRRPLFNTRDEPHADPAQWMRLHVIAGDANMVPSATARKVGLVKLAIALAEAGEAPVWELKDPVRALQAVSKDESWEFRVELANGSWTTVGEILESYFAAAEQVLELPHLAFSGNGPEIGPYRVFACQEDELTAVVGDCRALMGMLRDDPIEFSRSVDWAAKRKMLGHFMQAEETNWADPSLQSFDLAYHNVDSEEGLYFALADTGEVEERPPADVVEPRLRTVFEPTRAMARGVAVRKFGKHLKTAGWRTLTFEVGSDVQTVELKPDGEYPSTLADSPDVAAFLESLGSV